MTLRPTDNAVLPVMQIPSFRTSLAIARKTERNLLFRTWGGLGDQICSEPAIRYGLNHFKDCRVTLASDCPDLFRHLKFVDVIDLKKATPRYDDYFVFEMIRPVEDLQWEFMSHMLVNCVDFPSLCAFRAMMPVADREINLTPTKPSEDYEALVDPRHVYVHAGRHWVSKTFPKDWWDGVIQGLVTVGLKPILIGADTDDNRGTVEVETNGCIDLRNKLTPMESVWLLQRAKVLLTNDSSPLHMAASHDPNEPRTNYTWIGYVASCKHPDFISHWRHGVWNYREHNFGRGGVWDVIDHCPNKEHEVSAEFVEETLLRSWLPAPSEVVAWTQDKVQR